MTSAALIQILKSKPENQAHVQALGQFVRQHSQASEVNELWIAEVWQFMNNFPLPMLVSDGLPPLWNRLILGQPKQPLVSAFLDAFKQFTEQHPEPFAIKLLQQYQDASRFF